MKPTMTSKRNGIDDIDRLLDEALQQTFPACDPVACTWPPSRRPASTRRTASSAARATANRAPSGRSGPEIVRTRPCGCPQPARVNGYAPWRVALPIRGAICDLIRGSRT
jgi:hypothetical protein